MILMKNNWEAFWISFNLHPIALPYIIRTKKTAFKKFLLIIVGFQVFVQFKLRLVDYLNAVERALKLNQNMKIPDIMRQMINNLPTNPNLIKLFSPRAKRMLARRQVGNIWYPPLLIQISRWITTTVISVLEMRMHIWVSTTIQTKQLRRCQRTNSNNSFLLLYQILIDFSVFNPSLNRTPSSLVLSIDRIS